MKPLDARHIERFLPPHISALCAGKITVFKTIDSTNSEAKRRLSCAENSAAEDFTALHGTVLIAEEQSGGRGRSGKSFFSPAGSGIYLSLIYVPDILEHKSAAEAAKSADTSLMTAFAAVCVCRSLNALGIDGRIKWVNDVFVNGKKACGILTEGFMRGKKMGAAVVGVGINVCKAQCEFPGELRDIAGYITENSDTDRNALAASVISNMLDAFSGKTDERALMDEYKNRSFILGKRIRVISPQGMYEAIAREITDDAHLIVEDSAGKRYELLSGEVSLRV